MIMRRLKNAGRGKLLLPPTLQVEALILMHLKLTSMVVFMSFSPICLRLKGSKCKYLGEQLGMVKWVHIR